VLGRNKHCSEVLVGGIYHIGQKIGRGSFGDVFIGTNLMTEEKVAIKMERVKVRYPQIMYECRIYDIIHGKCRY
jgi:serine/threonine protein kinase